MVPIPQVWPASSAATMSVNPLEFLMFTHRSRSPLAPIRRRLRRSQSGESPAASRRPTISSAELERLYNYGTLLRVR